MEELEKILETIPTENPPQEPIEQPIVEQPEQEPQDPKSPSSQHFKTIKQLKEKAEKERDEALRRLQEVEASRSQPVEDLDINLGNDELAEGKHLNKVDRKIKKLEDTIKQYQQQSAVALVEAKLKIQYPDIESVVSKENIEILSMQHPEIAATINSSSDLYSKAVTAYTLIKKLGIQPEDHYQSDRLRAQTNAAKPRPLTSVNPQQGDSPLSHANAFANGLTDELKAQLLKEMKNAMR